LRAGAAAILEATRPGIRVQVSDGPAGVIPDSGIMQGAASHTSPVRTRHLGWLSLRGRVPLAWRSLVYDPLRLVISVGGLAFAVVLVLLLRGIMDGTVAKSTSYIDHVGADVFVAQHGVTNLALAASSIPQGTADSLASETGVVDTGAVIRIEAMVRSASGTSPGVVIAFDSHRQLGGPWSLSRGRTVEQPGEVVLDSVLASELGVGQGSTIEVSGKAFHVVGLSRGTAAIAGKPIFMELSDGQSLLHTSSVSWVLLKLAPAIDAASFAERLGAAHPDLQVLTRSQLSANDRKVLGRLFVEPINVMSTVGLLVGLAIVGLTMYTTTSERLNDFGVLKAIGAPSTFLLRTVIAQAVIVGLTGFVAGFGIAQLAAPMIVWAVPDLGVSVGVIPMAQTLAAVMAMSFVGALVPVVRILGVDPLMVFRR
jgi:putative ABC transport system permease protein